MSDIAFPAGFGLFLYSFGLGLFSLALLPVFLIVAVLGDKARPFTKRRGFSLFLGTLIPLCLALAIMFFSQYGPLEWRWASDRINPLWYWLIPIPSLVLGLGWGMMRRLD